MSFEPPGPLGPLGALGALGLFGLLGPAGPFGPLGPLGPLGPPPGGAFALLPPPFALCVRARVRVRCVRVVGAARRRTGSRAALAADFAVG